jgi:hypothetical protein
MERIKTCAYISKVKMEDVNLLMNSESLDYTLTNRCFSELKNNLGVNSLDRINYRIIEKEKIFGQINSDFIENIGSIRLTIYFEINN